MTVEEYGQDRYCLIGPLSYKTAPLEVESLAPKDPVMKAVLDTLQAQGVQFLYGRWLVESAPMVLLFDVAAMYHRLNEWKVRAVPCRAVCTTHGHSELLMGLTLCHSTSIPLSLPLSYTPPPPHTQTFTTQGDLWEKTGIPSDVEDFEMKEAIIFGYLVAWFLGEVRLLKCVASELTPGLAL